MVRGRSFMCRKQCLIGVLLAAFGLGLLVSCLFGSGFLLVLVGLMFLALGLFLFLR